ncbi:MAG: hypothetical protein ABFD59_10295 [Smithella sp.]
MNRLITGSLIQDSEPFTSLLKLISGSEKHIASGNAAANCFVCFNDIVMIKNVSCDEKNEGSIMVNIFFTIAAGFQT